MLAACGDGGPQLTFAVEIDSFCDRIATIDIYVYRSTGAASWCLLIGPQTVPPQGQVDFDGSALEPGASRVRVVLQGFESDRRRCHCGYVGEHAVAAGLTETVELNPFDCDPLPATDPCPG